MNFWKTFGASLLAFAVTSALVIGAVIFFIFQLLLSFEVETGTVPNQSVLYINLTEDITDAPTASPLGALDATTMTLSEPVTIQIGRAHV